jgi:hypothetical protein
MNLSKIGLIAAAAMVLLSPAVASAQAKINPANQKKGMAEAPAIVTASGTSCTLSDALFMLTSTDTKTKTKTEVYEIACTGGMGRVILKATAPDGVKYQVFDCLTTGQPYPDGKPNQLKCNLPANVKPETGLAPFLTKAAVTCEMSKARALGQTSTTIYFEVACGDNRGFIVGAPISFDASQEVSASNCLAFEAGTAMECKLTTRDQQLGVVNALATSADAACVVKDRRYILSSRSGDEYYEVACASGTGFVTVADSKGALKQKIDCANADSIAGGCTLTDVKNAKTEDNALYTRLVKAQGFNCDVTGYRALTADASGETIEVQCGNRGDGAVAVLTKAGPGSRFYNCAAAQTTGYRCGLTKQDAAYAALTASVKKARPTSTCQVSEALFMGLTPDAGFVEVACADKEPGYVLKYLKTSDQVGETFYCSQARTLLGVACKLPTNLPRG